MAEAHLYINDQYAADTSTKTVMQYVDLTIGAAKSDIIQDIRPEINDIVDEKIASLDINPDRFSLTNHYHSDYALVSETYSKQEVDLKVAASVPDLSPYATKDELSDYSPVSHQHTDYALSSDVYTKSETDDLVNSFVPDLSDYPTKEELQQQLNNYSTISHTHSDYALAESVYTKSETENLVSSFVPDLSSYYTKSETLDLISGFKNIQYLTTESYESLENKDPSTLYVLTDSTEEEIDLTGYITNDELSNELAGYSTVGHLHEAYATVDDLSIYATKAEIPSAPDLSIYATKEEIEDFKKIVYITQEDYNDLVEKEEETLYIITDSSQADASIDLSNYYTKAEIDGKNYKSIIYIAQDDYNELENKDENTLYIITDSSQDASIDLSAYKPITYLTTQEYEELQEKDENTLYVLTDSSQDASIDLSVYKPITYLTTQEYEELQEKDENTLYVLTDSSINEVDLSDYLTRDEILNDYYDKITIDSSISAIENTFANYYDSSTVDSMLENYYDKTTIDSSISEIDSALSGKQDSLHINDNAYLSMSDGLLDIHMKEYGDDGYYQIYLDNEMYTKISYYNADNSFSSEELIGNDGIYITTTKTNNDESNTYSLSIKMNESNGELEPLEIKYKVQGNDSIDNGIYVEINSMLIGLADEINNKYASISFDNVNYGETEIDVDADDFSWRGETVVTRDVLDSSISALESTIGDIQTILASI